MASGFFCWDGLIYGLRDSLVSLIRLRQQPRQQFSPPALTGLVGDEVLANFDGDVVQTAPLAVNGNRVIGRVSHSVGLVITDHETLLAPQEVHQQMGKTRITVVEHADMPRPRRPP
jgi:hypothetical protein